MNDVIPKHYEIRPRTIFGENALLPPGEDANRAEFGQNVCKGCGYEYI